MDQTSFLLFAFWLFLGFPCFSQAPVSVTVNCDSGYYPYSYADGTTPNGAYVELLEKAFARLDGYRVEIVPVPWNRGLEAMKTGQGFALFPPYRLPDVRPWLDCTLKLYDEKIEVLANEHGPAARSQLWPGDFSGLRIGLNLGFGFLDRWKDRLNFIPVNSNEIGILKLQAGQIDAYVNDELVMAATIRDLRAAGKIPGNTRFIRGPTVKTEESYLALTATARDKYPFLEDFRSKMAAILQKMADSGETKRIMESYTD